ncbi:hypothetical protein D0Z07_5133 [Hyphodiscus hymeniophilus]|uniref:AB hydrolase-1 domain-containing protein n=1 Tax=Hyphodiscus hymeniophilus TaxID=353542 RepID=A0A9P7AWM3_9HELO|nr:hypothetical protein D0Z07_5133 [Hyphodiscus hymeniophilus]
MSRPTFVCVPGASHSHIIYNSVKTGLEYYGYEVVPLGLPSVGGNPATYDFTEDVLAIRNYLTTLAETGREVILVMHGYAGVPGGEALHGLSKEERERRGLRGGVVRLVFIMAYMVREGYQASARGDISAMFHYMRCNVQAGITTVDPLEATEVFYNDLSRPEAEYWASQLLPQSIGVFWSRTTYAAWRYIPSTYVLCGRDQSITLPYAEMILRAAQDSQPHRIDSVERCAAAGHCVMLSQVQWTVDMLRRAAGERTG